jgi:hypothetical protein
MTLRAAEMNFVEKFFSAGNGIDLKTLSKSGRMQLEPWLQDLADPTDLPVLLPRNIDGDVYWYVLTFSDRQSRAVAADLLGLVGPSYTDFDGIPRSVTTADPIDEVASKLTDGRAFRIRVLPKDRLTRDQVRDQLLLLRQLWSERPAHAAMIPRPTGRMLRDFEMALQAGLDEESQALLDELRSQSRLTASNLLFLRIHRLAALRRWSDLLNLPELDSVLQMRRPNGVSEDIRRAVYLNGLISFERDENPLEAIRSFREEIAPRYSSLMQLGPGQWSAETAKLLMLHAVANDPQLPALANDALGLVPTEGGDRQWLLTLKAIIPPAPPRAAAKSVIEQAIADMDAGRFASAAGTLRDSPPSRTRTEILLRCAYETGVLELAQLASSALSELDAPEREAILRQRWYRDQWNAIRNQSGADESEDLPTDWASWLRWVDQGADTGRAVRVAREGADQWNVADLSKDPGRINELVDLLGNNREGQALEIVRLALPHILMSLRRSNDPALRPVHEAMFLLLAYDSLHSAGDLQVLLDLLEEFLAAGVDADKYRYFVSALIDVWRAVDSPRYIDWALDALEVLITYPSKSAKERDQFASDVWGSLAKWARRVDAHQWDLARNLSDDLGAREQFDGIHQGAIAAQPKVEAPAGGLSVPKNLRRVAVYSLTESVLQRVRNILEKALPGLTVDTCSDKVGSDRLKQLARQVDVFLMAPRSAKHAATDFIKANRGADKPLLVAAGSGSASLIREFFSFMATQE